MHLRSKRYVAAHDGRGMVDDGGWVCGRMGSAAGGSAAGQRNSVHKQPSLTVDRDPVPSPDPDAPAPSQIGYAAGVGLAKIEREGGKYTLREDAYEVRLNATVLDGSGKSIQTLTKDAFTVYEDGVPADDCIVPA